MASLYTDSTSAGAHTNAPNPKMNSSSDPLTGLPQDHVVRTFSRLSNLAKDAADIQEKLKEKNGSGNQWLVILGLTKQAIEKLDNDKDSLGGVSYRLQWEGTVGVIKILPGSNHDYTTSNFLVAVNDQLSAMGIPQEDRRWGGTTTYKSSTGNKGKQGDQIFTPASRRPAKSTVRDWPTLVVETAVSESYPKLTQDIKWWFENSSGRVRIVIAIVVRAKHVDIEKWQLVPPNAPRPVTRSYIDQLKQQTPNLPPLTSQPAADQTAYCAQKVVATATDVENAPLIIPFQALYDRAPGPNEIDVVLPVSTIRSMVYDIFH